MSRKPKTEHHDTAEYLAKKAYFQQFLTVYGRNSVLEALVNPATVVARIHLAEGSSGSTIDRILSLATKRGVEVFHTTRERVTRISRNGRQDQGIAADLKLDHYQALSTFLSHDTLAPRLLLLDGVTTPANVGMTIRSCRAGGMNALILPERGCASICPMVLKASAGTAFGAHLLRCSTALEGVELCRRHGYVIAVLSGEGGESLFSWKEQNKVVYVLGSEGSGVCQAVNDLADVRLTIPMADGVESLNVAVAASLVAYRHQMFPG